MILRFLMTPSEIPQQPGSAEGRGLMGGTGDTRICGQPAGTELFSPAGSEYMLFL